MPEYGQPLLQFDGSSNQLDKLMSTEFLLSAGSNWLCRIQSDGTAYQQRTMAVRPGQKYILLYIDGDLDPDQMFSIVDIECLGVEGLMLDLPRAISTELDLSLARLGLDIAQSMRIGPAGLGAVRWDGEGAAEWFSFESPCVGIVSDHYIRNLNIAISYFPDHTVQIANHKAGVPVFLDLGRMPPGHHTLTASDCAPGNRNLEPLGKLDIQIRDYEGTTDPGALRPQCPLQVEIEPSSPDLEEFWEGLVEVSARGPKGVPVYPTIRFLQKFRGKVILNKKIPPIDLPFGPQAWNRHFSKHVRNVQEFQEAYDFARYGEIELAAPGLGHFQVQSARKLSPLRWILTRKRKKYLFELIDDTGVMEETSVSMSSFEKPDIQVPVELEAKMDAPPKGGGFFAEKAGYAASIIVPPQVHGLEDLKTDPVFSVQVRTADSLNELIAVAGRWGRANIPGELFSELRRRDVLRALAANISKTIAGTNWANAERSYRALRLTPLALSKEVSKSKRERAFSDALLRECSTWADLTCAKRVSRFADFLLRHRLLSRDDFAGNMCLFPEFVLRLSSGPQLVIAWSEGGLQDSIGLAMEHTSLYRAARYAVLTTESASVHELLPTEVYTGWSW